MKTKEKSVVASEILDAHKTKQKYIAPVIKVDIIQHESSIAAGSAAITVDHSVNDAIEVEDWKDVNSTQQSYL